MLHINISAYLHILYDYCSVNLYEYHSMILLYHMPFKNTYLLSESGTHTYASLKKKQNP